MGGGVYFGRSYVGPIVHRENGYGQRLLGPMARRINDP